MLNEKHVAMQQRRHASTLHDQRLYVLFRWGCICLFLDGMHRAEERQGLAKQPCMPGRHRQLPRQMLKGVIGSKQDLQ